MSMIYFSKFWDTASAAHCQVLYLKNKSGILSSRTKTGMQRNRPHSLLSSSSFNLNTLLRTCLQYSNTQTPAVCPEQRWTSTYSCYSCRVLCWRISSKASLPFRAQFGYSHVYSLSSGASSSTLKEKKNVFCHIHLDHLFKPANLSSER